MKKILAILFVIVLTACNSSMTSTEQPTAGVQMQTSIPTNAVFNEPTPTRTPFPLITFAPALGVSTIVVTSVSDAINGDVSNVEKLVKNPGSDGISLREALTVSNLTKGPKYISFDPLLAGKVIMVSSEVHEPLPKITSGDVVIDGDINKDGKPDIVLDGSKGEEGKTTSWGLVIWSSGNQINGINFQNFAGATIIIGPQSKDDEKLIQGNYITNNSIDAMRGGGGILFGTFGMTTPGSLNDFTWKDTIISGNLIKTKSDFGITLAVGGGASRNTFIGTTITDNIVTGAAGVGILNSDTNSNWPNNKSSTPIHSTDNVVIDTLIANNHLDGASFYAISILGANNGNQNSRISNLTISGNIITNSPIGINITTSEGEENEEMAFDSQATQGNLIENVLVEKNIIQDAQYGIFVAAAEKLWMGAKTSNLVDNQLNQIVIMENVITNYSVVGIEVWAGRSNNSLDGVRDNQINDITIRGNILSSTKSGIFAGILMMAGLSIDERGAIYTGSAENNSINNVNISNNQIHGVGTSIEIIAGRGKNAKNNRITELFIGENDIIGDPVIIVNDIEASENSIN